MFNKKDKKSTLEFVTLNKKELRNVAGGMLPCTCSTYSSCHIDGAEDTDN